MTDLASSAAVPAVAPGYLTLPPPLPETGPAGPPPPEPGEENDPWRFGWRYVHRTLPDGTETCDQVPLSWDDLLYPEEDDFVVQKPPHLEDFLYCHHALRVFHAGAADVVVLGDCRIDFGAAGVRPLGPDVVLLYGVRQWLREGTFHVAQEGGRPVLVLEVASPSTRPHDLINKPDLYFRAGVEKYVILDRGRRSRDPLRLIGYQRGSQGWLPLALDAHGRLDLSPVGILIGVEGNRPWLYDKRTGAQLPDAEDEARARVAAEAKARDAETKASDAESKARDAQTKASDAKAQARDAKAQARDAKAQARDAEARARDAETKAKEEADRRTALEERLRALEEQLRQQQEPG